MRSHVQALFRKHRHLTSPALTKIQLEKGQRVRFTYLILLRFMSLAHSLFPVTPCVASGLTRLGKPNMEMKMNIYGLYCDALNV